MVNSEGTTWGTGPASFGLSLLIPSLNILLGAARSRNDHKFGWYAIVAGVFGFSITFWRMYQVDQMLKHGLEFWAPVPLYQIFGLCFLIFLMAIGVVSIYRNG